MYKALSCKMALNKTSANFTPYKYDLNIYRGCEHRCQYCYAVYSHKFLEDADFFQNVYYKDGIAQALDRQLSDKKLKGQLIGVGTVCDSYQPLEKQLELTRECLKVFIKHKNPIYISTKSPLIERDVDLIEELSKITSVSVSVSITTLDEQIAKKIESNVVSSARRFEILRKIKDSTHALAGVHLMPIIPFLTDNEKNLEEIFKTAKKLKLDYVVTDMLNLYGETRKNFFSFFHDVFPEIEDRLKALYSNSRSINAYKIELAEKIRKIKKRERFVNHRLKAKREKNRLKQVSMFEEE